VDRGHHQFRVQKAPVHPSSYWVPLLLYHHGVDREHWNISKDTTAWKGSCGETKLSFVQSLVNITGSKVDVCDDKIILCANNAELVFGLEPTVAIDTRSTTYMQSKKASVIAAYLAFLSGVLWIEGTTPSP
jgi:hypothetical protein